ncbi:ABC transporter substrate-binding protein [Paenibacillus crassostreae]|uniref:ABC transporter substrate-binding protein n=1 Tax=Paenibacillus crassostreae TaxID=1763538 RepID=A0A167GUL1_9BACL|nr:ABC transporter substrate-binding protein [Paenibacillus crassostreae]OAB77923.1 ABC transporter substrate-binding protein [Paenibacillus crassostreae]
MNHRLKKMLISMLTVIMFMALLIPAFIPIVQAESQINETSDQLDMSIAEDLANATNEAIEYSDYLEQYDTESHPELEVIVEANQYIKTEGQDIETLEDYEGMDGTSLLTGEEGEALWQIHIDEPGLYNLSALYYPIAGKSSSIERSLRIDGALPFEEAAYLHFDRIWDNELKEVQVDNQGNDLRPQQVERPNWREVVIKDSEGYFDRPFQFYFSKGDHTISLQSQREPMVIRQLKLFQSPIALTYEEVLKQYESDKAEETKGILVEIQGENAIAKSSPTLYPVSERTSPAVYPYSPSKVKVNTIGGHNWRIPGEWIEWEVDVPETGLYQIAFKSQQNFVRGIYSTRILTIDGVVPFQEMEQVAFRYKGGYRMDVMGGEDPYRYYLEKGKHVLRLEVSLGEFAPLIREVEESLFNLNAMYRKILMITGTNPDEVRDYRVEMQIPNLLEVFQTESTRLQSVAKQLKELSGQGSDQEALLKTMALQLDEMIDEPDTIPRRLGAYKTNTGGLGTWLQKAREQPLEIDTIYIASPDEQLPMDGMGWFAKMWHEWLTFVYSFVIDYNQIGNVAEGKEKRTVTVWIGSGRDQANTIKSMIDESFTSESGISVNLKLVQMNTLLSATLAGQGPDVAMQITNDIPVNYAMRNATTDLSKFNDFEDVAERFRTSALVPYTYNEGVYALPETQTFNMLFYRKDILKELELDVPQTWDDVQNLLAVLNKNHMEFGLPLVLVPSYPGENIAPNSVYAMLLMQSGGSFYREGGKASDLDSRKGTESFKQWTEFYTDYKLEKEYDFANRFRTGQMPVAIADYTVYNQLSVFAPEIRGMWGFVPVPGTLQSDGTINRVVPSGGNGVIMMEAAEDKEAAWEFMKWWTSEETQVQFGREMEGLMGAAARYPTANTNALDQLPWPVSDYQNLKAQFEWVQGIPEVPGGYFTGRHLLNAFYKVVNNKVEPREALMDYTQYIQDEIRTKRKEFGLLD